MHINGLGSVPNIPSSQKPSSSQPVESQPPAETKPSEDQVEISAKRTGDKGEPPDLRALRLAQIKAAIESGEYETEDKLDAALSRLFDELNLDEE